MCIRDRWQTFPNANAAEEASYEEYKANLRRNAQNFRITDEHLGEGGPKAKLDVYKRQALRRSAPLPITFEAMAADTDGYFSADHQKIACLLYTSRCV